MLPKQFFDFFVVELGAFVRSQFFGHALLEHFSKGISHRNPFLVLEWYQPTKLGENIDDAQEKFVALVSREGTHIHQIGCLGFVHTSYYHSPPLEFTSDGLV